MNADVLLKSRRRCVPCKQKNLRCSKVLPICDRCKHKGIITSCVYPTNVTIEQEIRPETPVDILKIDSEDTPQSTPESTPRLKKTVSWSLNPKNTLIDPTVNSMPPKDSNLGYITPDSKNTTISEPLLNEKSSIFLISTDADPISLSVNINSNLPSSHLIQDSSISADDELLLKSFVIPQEFRSKHRCLKCAEKELKKCDKSLPNCSRCSRDGDLCQYSDLETLKQIFLIEQKQLKQKRRENDERVFNKKRSLRLIKDQFNVVSRLKIESTGALESFDRCIGLLEGFCDDEQRLFDDWCCRLSSNTMEIKIPSLLGSDMDLFLNLVTNSSCLRGVILTLCAIVSEEQVSGNSEGNESNRRRNVRIAQSRRRGFSVLKKFLNSLLSRAMILDAIERTQLRQQIATEIITLIFNLTILCSQNLVSTDYQMIDINIRITIVCEILSSLNDFCLFPSKTKLSVDHAMFASKLFLFYRRSGFAFVISAFSSEWSLIPFSIRSVAISTMETLATITRSTVSFTSSGAAWFQILDYMTDFEVEVAGNSQVSFRDYTTLLCNEKKRSLRLIKDQFNVVSRLKIESTGALESFDRCIGLLEGFCDDEQQLFDDWCCRLSSNTMEIKIPSLLGSDMDLFWNLVTNSSCLRGVILTLCAIVSEEQVSGNSEGNESNRRRNMRIAQSRRRGFSVLKKFLNSLLSRGMILDAIERTQLRHQIATEIVTLIFNLTILCSQNLVSTDYQMIDINIRITIVCEILSSLNDFCLFPSKTKLSVDHAMFASKLLLFYRRSGFAFAISAFSSEWSLIPFSIRSVAISTMETLATITQSTVSLTPSLLYEKSSWYQLYQLMADYKWQSVCPIYQISAVLVELSMNSPLQLWVYHGIMNIQLFSVTILQSELLSLRNILHSEPPGCILDRLISLGILKNVTSTTNFIDNNTIENMDTNIDIFSSLIPLCIWNIPSLSTATSILKDRYYVCIFILIDILLTLWHPSVIVSIIESCILANNMHSELSVNTSLQSTALSTISKKNSENNNMTDTNPRPHHVMTLDRLWGILVIQLTASVNASLSSVQQFYMNDIINSSFLSTLISRLSSSQSYFINRNIYYSCYSILSILLQNIYRFQHGIPLFPLSTASLATSPDIAYATLIISTNSKVIHSQSFNLQYYDPANKTHSCIYKSTITKNRDIYEYCRGIQELINAGLLCAGCPTEEEMALRSALYHSYQSPRNANGIRKTRVSRRCADMTYPSLQSINQSQVSNSFYSYILASTIIYHPSQCLQRLIVAQSPSLLKGPLTPPLAYTNDRHDTNPWNPIASSPSNDDKGASTNIMNNRDTDSVSDVLCSQEEMSNMYLSSTSLVFDHSLNQTNQVMSYASSLFLSLSDDIITTQQRMVDINSRLYNLHTIHIPNIINQQYNLYESKSILTTTMDAKFEWKRGPRKVPQLFTEESKPALYFVANEAPSLQQLDKWRTDLYPQVTTTKPIHTFHTLHGHPIDTPHDLMAGIPCDEMYSDTKTAAMVWTSDLPSHTRRLTARIHLVLTRPAIAFLLMTNDEWTLCKSITITKHIPVTSTPRVCRKPLLNAVYWRRMMLGKQRYLYRQGLETAASQVSLIADIRHDSAMSQSLNQRHSYTLCYVRYPCYGETLPCFSSPLTPPIDTSISKLSSPLWTIAQLKRHSQKAKVAIQKKKEFVVINGRIYHNNYDNDDGNSSDKDVSWRDKQGYAAVVAEMGSRGLVRRMTLNLTERCSDVRGNVLSSLGLRPTLTLHKEILVWSQQETNGLMFLYNGSSLINDSDSITSDNDVDEV